MKKKKIVAIILSVVLFLAIAVLGAANVYRIDSVSLLSSTISEQAKEEAEQLEDKLNDVYVGGNTLFVDREAADIVLEDFPYFRIVSFKKELPNHLVIEVKEDEEMFAVALNDAKTDFAVLGVDGVYLGRRSTTENRIGEYHNILVTGLSFDGDLGKVVSGNVLADGFVKIIKSMAAAEGMNGSLRGNVLSMDVSVPAPSDNPIDRETLLTILMREGLVVKVKDFEVNSVRKAQKLMQVYFDLPDNEKLTGTLTILEGVDGRILANYEA